MWEGFAPFKITEKVEAATDIAAFTVVPANDDIDLSKLSLSAGQYITVKADPEDSDHLALRHYSLYSATSDKGIQFAVRRDNRNEHYGLVSNHLHDHLDVGDTILSMLEAQVTANPKRPIVWVYACQNKEHHAFDSKVNELLAAADNVEKHIFYFESGQILDEAWLANLPKPADIYVCGSMMFMESIIDGLMALDHGVDSVHYEPFGPKMSLELA